MISTFLAELIFSFVVVIVVVVVLGGDLGFWETSF